MNDDTLARVMRATELTRAGRLAEATALLQGNLTAQWPAGVAPTSGARSDAATDDVIDVDCVEVGIDADRLARAPASEPSSAASAPGRFIAGEYGNGAGKRAYKIFVPTRYTGQPLPLVVMLHGCTQNPDDFAAGTQMNTLGDAHDCFVLYPAQAKGANTSQCWNWFQRENQVRDRGEPSIIAGMTRAVVDQYNIDASRIYVAGMSAGGAMAAVMAVAYPELFAAVGIHSGLACGSAHDLPSALAAMKGMPAAGGSGRASSPRPHSTPTIVFHGDRDRTVHPSNGAHVIAQSAHAQSANAEDGGAADVTSERGQASGHAYTRTIHRDASGDVVLEHWLVHGGGHTWFGGSRAGSHTDPRGPNATQEMLRFFLHRG